MNPLIPIEYFVLLAVAALAAAAWIAWRSTRRIPGRWRAAVVACRILAVGGVLLLLLNLGRQRQEIQTLDASWAIMLDESASMAFADGDAGSRFEAARRIVGQAFEQSRDPKKIKLYGFSGTVAERRAENLDKLTPDGGDTQIVESGLNLLLREKTRGSKLLGILLLSDGRQPVTRSADPLALRAAAQNVPIYPVVLGGPVPSKDLALEFSRRRFVCFAGQPFTLQGEAVNHRMGPVSAEILLRDSAGQTLDRTELLVKENERLPFKFDLTLEKPGYYEYILETPLRQGESDRANNSVGLGVFVLSERLKVLMLEGEPYWDTKFLSHLLRAQTNISMTAVFRVAEDKFFKVATGADMTSSDTDVFPASSEELAKYDLVVLGRGTEYFIDADRARMLADFVKNRGGCLFFARGKSYEGPDSFLQDLEPVTWGPPVRSDFSLRPMLEGEQVGLFGGLLPDRDDALWGNLPILTRAHACGQLRGFTSTLADGVPDLAGEAPFPLLVSKRYGSGLVLLINADGLWRWGFDPEVADDTPLYQNLWIQLFQWAVSFAEFNPGSDYMISTDRGTAHVHEPLRVRVRARAHVKAEDPAVQIYQGRLPVQNLALGADAQTGSGWSGLLALSTPGIYRLAVQTPDGKDLGAQVSVQILPPPGETDQLSADAGFLQELADKSGGRVVTGKDLPDLVRRLEAPETTVRKGDIRWETLWDRAWVLVSILFFFALEWTLRRRQGLH
jgi:hypothetical protein